MVLEYDDQPPIITFRPPGTDGDFPLQSVPLAAAGGEGQRAEWHVPEPAAKGVVLPRRATPTAPNIVYILADDLGYGDVKCLNPDGKIPTPNLDRLARAG